MNAQVAILGFSGANLLALAMIILKAGKLLQAFDTVTLEVSKLRSRVDQHSELLTRAIEQLVGLERRVVRLEDA